MRSRRGRKHRLARSFLVNRSRGTRNRPHLLRISRGLMRLLQEAAAFCDEHCQVTLVFSEKQEGNERGTPPPLERISRGTERDFENQTGLHPGLPAVEVKSIFTSTFISIGFSLFPLFPRSKCYDKLNGGKRGPSTLVKIPACNEYRQQRLFFSRLPRVERKIFTRFANSRSRFLSV